MKKTFRKVIASLLAVLMIISSAPISALAYYDFTGTVGYVELGEEDYINWDSSWEFADEIYTEVAADEYLGGHNGILDWQSPELVFTVSDMGNTTDGIIKNQYYGYSTTYNYDKVLADGHIKNPGELKAGDLIAVTCEVGGMETLYGYQIKGKYNQDYLIPCIAATGLDAKAATAATPVVGVTKYYSELLNAGTGLDLTDGNFNFGISANITTNASARYVKNADERFNSVSGLVANVFTFRVLQDCDLTDSNIWWFEEAVIYPYNPYEPEIEASGIPLEYGCTGATLNFRGEGQYQEVPVIYTGYEAPAATTQYTVTFKDINDNVISETKYDENTAAADVAVPSSNTASTVTEDGHISYSWPEVADVTADVTYKEVENVTPHDFTGSLVSVSATRHAATCAIDGCTYTGIPVDCTFDIEGEYFPATPEASGSQEWLCACGNSRTDEILYVPSVYTVEFQNAAGDIVSSQDYGEGTAAADVAVPANTATISVGADGHISYSWPAVADVTADVTYVEVASEVTAHTLKDIDGTAQDATCTEGGKEADQMCDDCGYVVTGAPTIANGHSWTEISRTPATVKDAEKIYYECSIDGATKVEEGAPALGVNITVVAEDLGSVTLNGQDVTAGATVNVPYGSDVVLTATPNDSTATFFGWTAENNKIVSENATATFKAIADVTYDAIIKSDADNRFTVVFYDTYGNAISSQTVASGADIVIPDGPKFVGYTFTGWSLTNDEIAALTASTSITAKYSKNASALYTVTADGCDITSAVGSATGSLADVPYDTLVTVTKQGAKAWKINDAVVAYGSSYTFYVGSDVTVVPVEDNVENAVPTVAAVSTSRIADSVKVSFLATRSMTSDCKYVNAGFIYGKNLANDDLVLEMVGKTGSNADSGLVKAYYCTTNAQQFSISYGVTAMAGTASARAFLAYEDATGEIQVRYAEPQVYTY
ncbi:MAG: InlB B-repeat-containing protein [Eubacterium sp.]